MQEWQDKVTGVEIFACIFLFPVRIVRLLSLPQAPSGCVSRGIREENPEKTIDKEGLKNFVQLHQQTTHCVIWI